MANSAGEHDLVRKYNLGSTRTGLYCEELYRNTLHHTNNNDDHNRNNDYDDHSNLVPHALIISVGHFVLLRQLFMSELSVQISACSGKHAEECPGTMEL